MSLDAFFRPKVNDYIKKNITGAKRILADLTQEFRNLRLNAANERVDFLGIDDDVIPLPDYQTIRSYVNRNRRSCRV